MDIAIFVPGLPLGPDTLETASLGGSETAGAYMARELARAGHDVFLFCNTDRVAQVGGVLYRPQEQFGAYVVTTPVDVALVQRTPTPFAHRTQAKLNLLWCHDLGMARQKDGFIGAMWNVDRVMVVSAYMAEQYGRAYGLPPETIWTTRNGIDADLARRYVRAPGERRRKRLIYAARPERGLRNMLERVLPRLLQADPDLELHVCGYYNKVPHMAPLYEDLERLAAGLPVHWRKPMTKAELYMLYGESGAYLYPTPSLDQPRFREVSCISAMEAQACGLPMVTSAAGAIPETLAPGAGTMIDGEPWSDAYVDAFCEAALRYVRDDGAYVEAQRAGLARASGLSWAALAQEWSAGFERLIEAKNDDSRRLAHHFYRRSDIAAAGMAAADAGDDAMTERLDAEFPFRHDEVALREHYLVNGRETVSRLSAAPIDLSILHTTKEPRLRQIAELVIGDDGAQRVLDYGCGHGWSTIYFANATGRAFVGEDIDPGAVGWADALASEHVKAGAATFMGPGEAGDGFDAAVCSEVLEHCIDPEAALEALERRVRAGGRVIFTVPFGPAEYATRNWIEFRNHIHEMELPDIRDMVGGKPKLLVDACMVGINEATAEPVGYWLVAYEADHVPVRRRDWSRKLRFQAPRQTLSVNLIGGPGVETTLRWCLDSVRWIADEIVIGDTGMSAEARRIADEFGARIVPAPLPTVEGFDAARNAVVDASAMDWVFWIDTDERLLEPQNIVKYLRSNMWNGYGVAQHHFAVDTAFPPDYPVRLFRRGGCRFIGRIHEHPETAMNAGPGRVIILPDLRIAHVGYLNENVRRRRFQRNWPLLQKDLADHPDRLFNKHILIRDLALWNRYELEIGGGTVTPAIADRAEKIVALYREHFIGRKSGLFGIDPIEYYSEAVTVLGGGVEVSFDVQVARDGLGDQMKGRPVMRFASMDDAQAELAGRLAEKLRPFGHPEW